MKTYYTPNEEQKVLNFTEFLTHRLSRNQIHATAPLKEFMDSSKIAQRFHTPQLMNTPAGIVMLAETLSIANSLGWQESPAQKDLAYTVFSTSALTHLQGKREQAEKMFKLLFRKPSVQEIELEPLFKLQNTQKEDEAYISYVNHHSQYRDIIIDRGNQLPLEIASELFYIPGGDDDIRMRTNLEEFLR